jgi:hypothetical protein
MSSPTTDTLALDFTLPHEKLCDRTCVLNVVSRVSNRLGGAFVLPGCDGQIWTTPKPGGYTTTNEEKAVSTPLTVEAKHNGRRNPFPGSPIDSGERLHFPCVTARFGSHRNRVDKRPTPGKKQYRPPSLWWKNVVGDGTRFQDLHRKIFHIHKNIHNHYHRMCTMNW